MTGFDIFFFVMAALQLIAIGVMAYVGARMLETLKQGQRRAQPAIREAKALADTGKAMAVHAKEEGQHVTARVKAVAARVKERVETTKRIAMELKPQAETAVTRAGAAKADLSHKAQTLKEMAQHVGRVKTAAEAARRAARNPYPAPPPASEERLGSA